MTECRDVKDNTFLELALSGKATWIISGDADLLVLHPFRGIDRHATSVREAALTVLPSNKCVQPTHAAAAPCKIDGILKAFPPYQCSLRRGRLTLAVRPPPCRDSRGKTRDFAIRSSKRFENKPTSSGWLPTAATGSASRWISTPGPQRRAAPRRRDTALSATR